MRQPRFRLQHYRFLQSGSPQCSFVLTGGSIAVDLQFHIFSCTHLTVLIWILLLWDAVPQPYSW